MASVNCPSCGRFQGYVSRLCTSRGVKYQVGLCSGCLYVYSVDVVRPIDITQQQPLTVNDFNELAKEAAALLAKYAGRGK